MPDDDDRFEGKGVSTLKTRYRGQFIDELNNHWYITFYPDLLEIEIRDATNTRARSVSITNPDVLLVALAIYHAMDRVNR